MAALLLPALVALGGIRLALFGSALLVLTRRPRLRCRRGRRRAARTGVRPSRFPALAHAGDAAAAARRGALHRRSPGGRGVHGPGRPGRGILAPGCRNGFRPRQRRRRGRTHRLGTPRRPRRRRPARPHPRRGRGRRGYRCCRVRARSRRRAGRTVRHGGPSRLRRPRLERARIRDRRRAGSAELAGQSVALAATVIFVVAAVSTPPLGALADRAGWGVFWVTTAGLALAGAALAATLPGAVVKRTTPTPSLP